MSGTRDPDWTSLKSYQSTRASASSPLLKEDSPAPSQIYHDLIKARLDDVTIRLEHLVEARVDPENVRKDSVSLDLDRPRVNNDIIEWLAGQDPFSADDATFHQNTGFGKLLLAVGLPLPATPPLSWVATPSELVARPKAASRKGPCESFSSFGMPHTGVDVLPFTERARGGKPKQVRRRASAPAMLDYQHIKETDNRLLDDCERIIRKRVSAPPDCESLDIPRTIPRGTARRLRRICGHESLATAFFSTPNLLTQRWSESVIPFELSTLAEHTTTPMQAIFRAPTPSQRAAVPREPCPICLEPYYQTVPAPDPYDFPVCEH
ncbi:hypothetical protein BDV96DRAFT_641973 [Lophiotrema nucula]|uniref:Uncharacterized protein n=1 Tax=Lophiotrema nucula TaxID=690887 RepID=A0A6A5ZKD4_9PLEO|nr:hypothetical protein BDV96DRAFT_641973 [Lophiotrema nucula]